MTIGDVVLAIAAAAAIPSPSAPAASASMLVDPPPTSIPIAAIVDEAARRFSIPQAWIYAVVRVESAGNPHAVSQKGAAGLMQLMPATWSVLRVRYGLGDDIFDVRDNILAGAAYLREMHDRYGSPGFLAAYNAGPGRYEEYRSAGRPLPAETIAYVTRLAPLVAGSAAAAAPIAVPDPRAWTRAALFAGHAEASDRPAPEPAAAARPDKPSVAAEPTHVGLFVPLSGPLSR